MSTTRNRKRWDFRRNRMMVVRLFFFLLSSLMLFVEEICPQFSSSSRKARSRNSNWKLTWQLLCSTKLVELWGIYFAFITMFPPPGKLETNKASNYSSKSLTTLAINFHDLRKKKQKRIWNCFAICHPPTPPLILIKLCNAQNFFFLLYNEIFISLRKFFSIGTHAKTVQSSDVLWKLGRASSIRLSTTIHWEKEH